MFVNISDALAVRCQRKQKRIGGAAIYALIDKADDGVRYVGKTTGSLPRRLGGHFRHPTNRAMAAWLHSTGRARVRIVILEHVERSEWEDAERGWVRWFQDRGELLNIDPGGHFRDSAGRPIGISLGVYQPPVVPERASRADMWTRLHRPMRRSI